MKQDPFVGCFNTLQGKKEKVAIKGLTLNTNINRFVKGKSGFVDKPCKDLGNEYFLWIK